MGAQPDKYDFLFKEASDLIQGLAMAYGERIAFEHACLQGEKASGKNKEVISKLIRLFAMDIIVTDLGFFMTEGLISVTNAKKIHSEKDSLVKEVAEHAIDIVESFPIPRNMLSQVPITGDYATHETSLPRL
mmetsp:Transcript_23412/g.17845  ORF Transcript_23412/g.17845 Transcript_23412/m.17845 type:complete len:132 (+) Transcript_23412:673-1068(+)